MSPCLIYLLVGDFGLGISVGVVDHSIEGLVDPLATYHLQGSSVHVCVCVHVYITILCACAVCMHVIST